jgi:Fe2+ transport system protein B
VKVTGVIVTATSAGLVHVIVYLSTLFAIFVTVLERTWVPFREARVIDGMLRSMGLPGTVGHTPPVDANTC